MGILNTIGGIAGAAANVATGGAAGAAGAAAGGAAGGTDTAASMASMQQTFAKAAADNAQITKIQTEGNTAKRAASSAPQ